MKLNQIPILAEKEIKTLLDIYPTMTYSRPAVVFYKGHIPHVSFLITKGKAIVRDKKREHFLGRGALIGIWELCQNYASTYDLLVSESTSLIALDKSTLQELNFNKKRLLKLDYFSLSAFIPSLRSG